VGIAFLYRGPPDYASPVAEPPPDPLELLRRESGLSIDLEGRFRHRGEPILHARTLEVLWRSLSRAEDGRYLVRIGREMAWVRIDDAPYGVRGASLEAGRPLLHLTDGSVEPLDPSTLRLGRDGVLRCTVKGGHRARFCRAAQATLGQLLEEPAPGRYQISIDGRPWPISVE
jgi:hypothetical protein